MEVVWTMIKGKWLSIPTAILNDEEMTRADVLVFGYIADRARNTGGEVELSRSVIMDACEVSRATVTRSIAKLERKGYLRATRRAGEITAYRQTLLEPKPQRKRSSARTESDMSKYECVINQFDTPGKEVG